MRRDSRGSLSWSDVETVSLPNILLETIPIHILLLLAAADLGRMSSWNCARSLEHLSSRNLAALLKGNCGSFRISDPVVEVTRDNWGFEKLSVVADGRVFANVVLSVFVCP